MKIKIIFSFIFLILFSNNNFANDYDGLKIAASNIIESLIEAERWPSTMDKSKLSKAKAKIAIIIAAEKEKQMLHLINEWSRKRSADWVAEHWAECVVCRRAKDLILELAEGDNNLIQAVKAKYVPLTRWQINMRNEYYDTLWDESGYSRDLTAKEAKKLIRKITSSNGIYRQVAKCKSIIFDKCKPGEDFNALEESNSSVENDLGTLYLFSGNFKKSLIHGKRALQLAPDNPIYYYNLGNTYINADNVGLAVEFWKQGVEVSNNVESHTADNQRMLVKYYHDADISLDQACRYSRSCLNNSIERYRGSCESFKRSYCN